MKEYTVPVTRAMVDSLLRGERVGFNVNGAKIAMVPTFAVGPVDASTAAEQAKDALRAEEPKNHDLEFSERAVLRQSGV